MPPFGEATAADAAVDDADLVARSLAGSREAFGSIVARYQALVCAIAYSATGSLGQSEDLAQETFLAAWRQLADLREPARLRSWLCGIVRNLVNQARRRDRREPARAGGPIDLAGEMAGPEPPVADQIISREEQAILWRTLEGIPATYREPLVLFYREHQSIERVASSLDLGEDVVRQRLTRGRKLLQSQVLAFVEGTLERSAPGPAFTMGVVATLPTTAAATTLATAGAAAAKGSALAKSATGAATIVALLGPLVGIFGAWFGVRANLDAARTPRERSLAVRQSAVIVGGALAFAAGVLALGLPRAFWGAHVAWLAATAAALPVVYATWLVIAIARATREWRRVRGEERALHPEAFADELRAAAGAGDGLEWKSRATLLGLPLWHVRLGVPPEGAGPVIAWVAIADRAVGVLLAMGAMSVGAVSVGGASVGLFTAGGVSVGLLSVGGVSSGLWAIGGVAAGVIATGGLAFGWKAAAGGAAFARDFAYGGLAVADHANDLEAGTFFVQMHTDAVFHSALAFTFVLIAVAAIATFRRTRRRPRPPRAPR